MTRLLNVMRQDICDRMMTHAFDALVVAASDQQAKLADRIYLDAFTSTERKTMASLPEGWLPTDNDIQIQFGDRMHRFEFSGEINTTRRELNGLRYWHTRPVVQVRFPHDMKGKCVKVYDVTDGIGLQAETWFVKACALNDEICAARTKLMTALNSYWTTEKLVEAWPETAPFVVPLAPVESAQLPALPTADLNTLFKLPAAKEAQ